MANLIETGSVVLFQGDSITDYGRRRDEDGLGGGYVRMAITAFGALWPSREVTFLNRGIAGDRTAELLARWQADCIDLKPDWVSIMVGVNDTWRRYDSDMLTTAEQYEANYRTLLERVRDELGAHLIIMEPYLVPTPDKLHWREDLDPKIQVARKLAREFDAVYLPLDGLFAAACVDEKPAYWAGDGVHPTVAGSAFIARMWLRAVGAI